MPVSVVVGGQFGSEGKGKVALEIVRRDRSVAAAVRVGGTNSGHTAIGRDGKTYALRQLPAAAIDRDVLVILPPGCFIDPEIFRAEVSLLNLAPDQIAVSPMARIISDREKSWERDSELGARIGSTQSGTGAAVLAMTARESPLFPLHSVQADQVEELQPFLRDTTESMRTLLRSGSRIVIEGTQGFGLSLVNGGYWPKATSRDATAASFVAESGLSPRDVDDITLVIRTFPIRVAGDSGPLVNETTWHEIARNAGLPPDLQEFTTATGRMRRVGKFDPELVRRAIAVNDPNRIVLNHLDYVDGEVRGGTISPKATQFIKFVEGEIRRPVNFVGIHPAKLSEWHRVGSRAN